MKRPHVLIVAPRMIHPLVSGGEIRIHSLLERLSGDYKVSLAAFVDRSREIEMAAAALRLEKAAVAKVHLVRRSGAQASPGWFFPDTAKWFFDPAMAEAVNDIVEREGVDIVHFEFTEMGQYASHLRKNVPVVLTEHDTSALSPNRSYLRDTGKRFPEKYSQLVLRWAYEARVLRRCDRIVTVSQADADRLRRLTPLRRISVIPTGVDLKRFAFSDLGGREAGRVLFLGHYPHFPNEDAGGFLAREIFPRIRQSVPEARLTLLGSSPTKAICELASSSVDIPGTVPDVLPFLAKARVFVAPMRLGFGIKGKILEAFAAGVPVVATRRSCEAMPGLSDGGQILFGETPQEIASQAVRLLRDEELSRGLAAAARSYAERHFNWDDQAKLLDQLYRSLHNN